MNFLMLIFCIFGSSFADLMRTAYCVGKCDDYLKLPESQIPVCQEEQVLKMNQCVTEMSCSWTEIDMEKQRRMANNSEQVICCYQLTLREGDCDLQYQHDTTTKSPSDCVHAPALLSFISILLIVVTIETAYIIWTCLTRGTFTHKIVDVNPRLLMS